MGHSKIQAVCSGGEAAESGGFDQGNVEEEFRVDEGEEDRQDCRINWKFHFGHGKRGQVL